MDEQEINCILNIDETVKRHYTGTIYCADTLPLKLTRGKFYISNNKESTHNFDKQAGHWISILCYNDGSLYYIDSFGLFPSLPFWMSLLSTNSTKMGYQPYQLQNYSTTTCAIHAITFCTLFSYNFTPSQILKTVYDVDDKNKSVSNFDYDHYAQKFLKSFYGEKRGLFYEP